MSQGRIDKIKELAQRGEGGERDNARTILDKLGIQWKKKEKVVQYRFKYADGVELVFLQLVFLSVLKERSKPMLVGVGEVYVVCTDAEGEEIKKKIADSGDSIMSLISSKCNPLLRFL